MTLCAGLEPSPMVQKAIARFEFEREIREALAPVIDWYQSDEHPGRDTVDIVRDVVADLEADRKASLILARIVLAARSVEGGEAHRIMPEIWPLICEASALPSMPPNKLNAHLKEPKA